MGRGRRDEKSEGAMESTGKGKLVVQSVQQPGEGEIHKAACYRCWCCHLTGRVTIRGNEETGAVLLFNNA